MKSLRSELLLVSKMNVYYSKLHKAHCPKGMHPECPQRVEACVSQLEGNDFIRFKEYVEPSMEGIVTKKHKWRMLDGDTYVTESTPFVLQASNKMIQSAAMDLCCGETRAGFVLCRPPGHHASPGKAAGFCITNNAWNAVEHLLQLGKRNICIYDMDAHHGDGTEACLRQHNEPLYKQVRFVSTHAYGSNVYPGTGAASHDEKVMNVPLAVGTMPGAYLRVFRNDVLPFIGKPEVLIVSAGYDTHEKDPMNLMKLTFDVYNKIGQSIRDLNIPTLFLLEGGYNPNTLGECVEQTILPWVKK